MTERPGECSISPGSFRDPSGTVYSRNGVLYRQVNRVYGEHYDRLMDSGLYGRLTAEGLMIPHDEAGLEVALDGSAYRVIRPQIVPFISYPYEWCFSQLKDAALCTLRIQEESMGYGMALKDASAYNIQFRSGKPALIDTLSFEKYREGIPWAAYRQFCQHFLAPLALMAYRDARLSQLLRANIDGIPLDLASRLLPARTKANPGILTHIHLHAASQGFFGDRKVDVKGRVMSRTSVMGLVDSLKSAVRRLTWKPRRSGWSGYYGDTNYSEESMEAKKRLVRGYLERLKPGTVWDLGANTGVFSRLASGLGASVVSMDYDPACVESNYAEVKTGGGDILPLVVDLTNPSPDNGWHNRERLSLMRRGPADAVLALALVHHLALSNNLPLGKVADFLSETGKSLIIEFIPKTDSQAQRLIAMKGDIFPDYTREAFEREFKARYSILDSAAIGGSERVLYLMEGRHG